MLYSGKNRNEQILYQENSSEKTKESILILSKVFHIQFTYKYNAKLKEISNLSQKQKGFHSTPIETVY